MSRFLLDTKEVHTCPPPGAIIIASAAASRAKLVTADTRVTQPMPRTDCLSSRDHGRPRMPRIAWTLHHKCIL